MALMTSTPAASRNPESELRIRPRGVINRKRHIAVYVCTYITLRQYRAESSSVQASQVAVQAQWSIQKANSKGLLVIQRVVSDHCHTKLIKRSLLIVFYLTHQ